MESERLNFIDKGVKIGKNVFIGHFAVIRENVDIGDNVVIGHCTVIEKGAIIREGSVIQSQCHITAGAIIGKYVYFGANVTMTNEKHISKWRPQMQQLLVGPIVGDCARIGSASVILPGVEIGRNSEIGAGTVVAQNVAAYTRIYGEVTYNKKLISDRDRSLVGCV